MIGEQKFATRRHDLLIQQNVPNTSPLRVLDRTCVLVPADSRQDDREIKRGRGKYGSGVLYSKDVRIKDCSDSPSAITSSWHSYEVRIGLAY